MQQQHAASSSREGDRDTRTVPAEITMPPAAASATHTHAGVQCIIHANGTAAWRAAGPLKAADSIGLFGDVVNSC